MLYYYGYGGGLSTGAYVGIAIAALAVTIISTSLIIYYRRRQARLLRESLQAQQNQPMGNPEFFQQGTGPGFKQTTQVNETVNYTNNAAFMYVPPEQPSAPPPTYDASRNDARVNQVHQAV